MAEMCVRVLDTLNECMIEPMIVDASGNAPNADWGYIFKNISDAVKEEFYHVVPTQDFFPAPHRLARWDLEYWSTLTQKLWALPLIAICLYIPIVHIGPKIFNENFLWRPKKLIAAWNLGLSIFSIIGAFVTWRALLAGPSGILNHGLFASACDHAHYGYGYTGVFVFLFIYSKLFELFDTYWLVFGDRKVICLHWYHHVTVLLYCWHAYSVRTSTGLWFVAMNYMVHSVMYLYFFFSQIGGKIRDALIKYKHLITILQISQMVVGTFISLYALFTPNCKANRLNAILGFLMYLSYFCLFAKLFMKIMSTKKKNKVKTTFNENYFTHNDERENVTLITNKTIRF